MVSFSYSYYTLYKEACQAFSLKTKGVDKRLGKSHDGPMGSSLMDFRNSARLMPKRIFYISWECAVIPNLSFQEILFMLEHIDPTIRAVIEDLKIKNPPLGNACETAQIERAMAFRDRPKPLAEAEIIDASAHVAFLIKTIDKWYETLQGNETWPRIKSERPSLANSIFEAQDRINEEFGRWKTGKSEWQKVEDVVDDYAKAWGKVFTGFSK